MRVQAKIVAGSYGGKKSVFRRPFRERSDWIWGWLEKV